MDAFHSEAMQKSFPSNVFSSVFGGSPSNNSRGVLCPLCTENQHKIIQLLQNFEVDLNENKDRHNYELYARKVESRYPLCATCAYRVSMQLNECQEKSLHYQRQTVIPKSSKPLSHDKLQLVKLCNLRNLFLISCV